MGYGVVFELMLNTNGRWTEKVLHTFNNAPAGNPVAGLVMDTAGNLYGTAMLGAPRLRVAADAARSSSYPLSPEAAGPTKWSTSSDRVRTDNHPTGDLTLDSAGNIYGTTQAGGAQGPGMVFENMH